MMTELLQKFVLVGESAGSNAAVKQVKVVTSAPPPTPTGTLTVTLHVMQDTSAALACKHIKLSFLCFHSQIINIF